MSGPRTLCVALGLVIALVLGGCGVAEDGSAEVADADDVPFGLLDEERDPVGGVAPGRGSVVDLYLYDPDEEQLAPVDDQLESTSLEDVLVALLDATPGDDPATRDLRSAIAETDVTIEAETDGGVAVIDLSEEFTDIGGTDQLIAIAQLVYTSTGRPGVGQVNFTLEGEPIEIPRGDGSITSGSVTRDDYRDLAPGT